MDEWMFGWVDGGVSSPCFPLWPLWLFGIPVLSHPCSSAFICGYTPLLCSLCTLRCLCVRPSSASSPESAESADRLPRFRVSGCGFQVVGVHPRWPASPPLLLPSGSSSATICGICGPTSQVVGSRFQASWSGRDSGLVSTSRHAEPSHQLPHGAEGVVLQEPLELWHRGVEVHVALEPSVQAEEQPGMIGIDLARRHAIDQRPACNPNSPCQSGPPSGADAAMRSLGQSLIASKMSDPGL